MPQPVLPPLPAAVSIREVGPRDGLQGERPLDPRTRARLVLELVAAGCRRVEAASFVSERAVPAMAGAALVIDEVREALGVQDGLVLAVLVPNMRGASDALSTGVDELTVTIAASPVYNQRNVRRTIAESVQAIGEIVAAASAASVPVDAVISCAFGSPYEPEIPVGGVAALVRILLATGVSAVTLADTTGMASPVRIAEVLDAVKEEAPGLDLGLHLHETRGTALANAYAALLLGVTRFDCSVGGLGGSPFAAGAGGNLSTEDFVSFLDTLGVETGIELSALLEVASHLPSLVGRDIESRVRASADEPSFS